MLERRTLPRGFVIAMLLASVSTPGPARAADETDSDDRTANPAVVQLASDGSRLYKEREYRRAVEKFIQAYAIDHDPNLLFNIARCYEKLGDASAAIEKYEEFLNTPGADAQGRQRAQDSLTALSQIRQKPAPSTSASAAATDQAEPQAEKPSATVEASAHSSAGVVPWLALGTGVASAGFGAVLYALGVSDHSTVTNSNGYGDPGAVDAMTEAEAKSLVDSGDTKKLIGGIGLGVGGALIATSIVMFVTGFGSSGPGETALDFTHDTTPQRTTIAVGIAPAPDGGSLSGSLAVVGSF